MLFVNALCTTRNMTTMSQTHRSAICTTNQTIYKVVTQDEAFAPSRSFPRKDRPRRQHNTSSGLASSPSPTTIRSIRCRATAEWQARPWHLPERCATYDGTSVRATTLGSSPLRPRRWGTSSSLRTTDTCPRTNVKHLNSQTARRQLLNDHNASRSSQHLSVLNISSLDTKEAGHPLSTLSIWALTAFHSCHWAGVALS